jgi:hypothetical protein
LPNLFRAVAVGKNDDVIVFYLFKLSADGAAGVLVGYFSGSVRAALEDVEVAFFGNGLQSKGVFSGAQGSGKRFVVPAEFVEQVAELGSLDVSGECVFFHGLSDAE